jgi:uncharacterized protein (UPF0548 family)
LWLALRFCDWVALVAIEPLAMSDSLLSLRRPTDAHVRQVIESQRELPFTYPEVGAIEAGTPAGYLTNSTRAELGSGEKLFDSAVSALRAWRQFDVGWVELCWPITAPEPGAVVGVLARAWGVWALSVSRIIDVIDEQTDRGRRFAVIYGTLPQHVECGEERFQITWNRSDNSVSYDVQAFFRPQHPLVRWGWPVLQRFPRRFVRESADAMRLTLASDGASARR